MPRPEPAQYNQAIQNPGLCFDDPELRTGNPELTPLGLPRAVSGSFASVYRIRCGGREWAVRCFLREVGDQERRYAEIAKHLRASRLPYAVGFEFLPKGIRVGGRWHPTLKMERVRGEPLDAYIRRKLHDPYALRALADRWLEMTRALRGAGVAHGDLQPGNVLVVRGGGLRLIDYDGMYVPALAGLRSHELGHRNYQSPGRSADHFGPDLDRFSAWVIYLSLLAFGADPGLGRHVGADSEHLLFRRRDFEGPDTPGAFRDVERVPDAEVRALAAVFRSFVTKDIALVPPLPGGGPARAAVSAAGPTSAKPTWLDDHLPAGSGTRTAADHPRSPTVWGASDWIADHLRPGADPRTDTQHAPERRLCSTFGVCSALLLGASLGGMAAPALASGIILSLLLLLAARYASLPEVAEKLTACSDVGAAQIAVWRAEATVKRLVGERERLRAPEVGRRECDRRRRRELDRADDDLRALLARLDAQEQETWRRQLEEIERALEEQRRCSPAEELARTPRTLPPGAIARLSGPYRVRRRELERRKQEALRSGASVTGAIERRYVRERERLTARARREQRVDREVAVASATLRRRRRKLALARRRYASRRWLAFGEYLRRELSGTRHTA